MSFLVNAIHIAGHSVCRTVATSVYFMLSVSQVGTLPKVSYEVSETERLKESSIKRMFLVQLCLRDY